jgi:hypothetical protein
VKPDGDGAGIFEPDAVVYAPSDALSNEQHIHAAEKRLGVPLPASYKTFLQVCGAGQWCSDYVMSPKDVYAFDEAVDDMEGFVTLVYNVRGVGDHVAMNPREQTVLAVIAL